MKRILIISLAFISIFYSCKTLGDNVAGDEPIQIQKENYSSEKKENSETVKKEAAEKENEVLKEKQNKLLEVADSLTGSKTYSKTEVNGRTFTLDCIGTVSAIYWGLGIDITRDFGKYKGNGVSRLYQTLMDKNLIHNNKIPKAGDVIFWDNTWDKNEDGILGNDELTHAGIVVKSDENGDISYIHANYVYGIVVEKMNLNDPSTYKDASGKVVNSILALNSSPKKHPEHWLSGDLWKEFGRILEKF